MKLEEREVDEGKHHIFLHKSLLQIKQIECIAVDATSGWERHELASHTLLFVTEGHGKLYMNDELQPIDLSRKSVYLLPAGFVLAAESDPTQCLSLCRIAFDMFRVTEWTELRRVYEKELTLPEHGEIRVKQYQRVRHLIQLLTRGRASLNEMEDSRKQLYLHELLCVLLDNKAAPISERTEKSLEGTIQYMQQTYHTDITLGKLADMAGMHPSYYSQLFKQKMKKSPIEYLTDLRMNQAKEHLLVSREKIRDIARDVGYKDEFYFSRRFKVYNGIAPTVYIKKHHSNIVSLSHPYTDHLLTLGVKPFATHIDKESPSMTKPVYDRVWEDFRQTLLKQKPDLILCKDHISLQMRKYIGDIAPVVTIPWTRLDLFGHLHEIARLVGKEQAAREWIERHEQRAEREQKKVKAVIGDGTVGLLTLVDNKVKLYGARNIGHVFYRSLQLTPPDRIQKEMDKHMPGTVFNWTSATTKNLSDYETDHLFIVVKTEGEAKSRLKEWQASESWNQHPAVKHNRVYVLDWDKWMVYAPRSIDQQLDEAVTLLTALR
ncbi:AraC family transcriptional regulator [Paenibacillus profundus]|uniref:AraC family transcriptional regulator n=1 Tax=Paenibacillus profundus TaxID=1173085 RepID=A0ABS8YNS2_9BACL|nr:AraC family transcriptional regulator [Paenibacillus profundus]